MVVFNRLEPEQLRVIVDIHLRRFASRLERRDLSLEVTDRAKDFLAEAGWDAQYGRARPFKRAIQKNIEDPLARKVLGGEVSPGIKASSPTEGRRATWCSLPGCPTGGCRAEVGPVQGWRIPDTDVAISNGVPLGITCAEPGATLSKGA